LKRLSLLADLEEELTRKSMNQVIQPPIDPRESGQPADELDGLLRDFFQSEMPCPWPAVRRPVSYPLASTSWRRRLRSSLALAASLALLALGLSALSGKFANRPSATPSGQDATGMHQPVDKDAPPLHTIPPEKQ
jgi:hypothetical protein